MNGFSLLLLYLVLQRISELLIARRNERILKSEGAVEFDKGGYLVLVAMHVAFFISLVSEKVFLERDLSGSWTVFAGVFVAAQILRVWAISTLGVYWNTKILVSPKHKLVTEGLYKYIKHPNYVAVVVEIATIPLIFSCYLTSIVFSVLNLILIKRRIRIEEESLRSILNTK